MWVTQCLAFVLNRQCLYGQWSVCMWCMYYEGHSEVSILLCWAKEKCLIQHKLLNVQLIEVWLIEGRLGTADSHNQSCWKLERVLRLKFKVTVTYGYNKMVHHRTYGWTVAN